MAFTVDYASILKQIDEINPIEYCQTRNYLDGAVSKLAPYISRGVISTRQVYDSVLRKGYDPKAIEGFLKQLVWRDYFQNTLIEKSNLFEIEIKQKQENVLDYGLSNCIINAETGIDAIDESIQKLYDIGYMHNHMRLYVASLATNIAKSDWRFPAKWMYYYLLDADVASNYCSWQWVCGANSSKKYVANQENINKYARSYQLETFLDKSYEEIMEMPVPEILKHTSLFEFETKLPSKTEIKIDKSKPTLLYNFYNLDPLWHINQDYNRVLLLEPSHFHKFPICENTLDFVLHLSKNIPNIEIYCGEFNELKNTYNMDNIIFKEHPLFSCYIGKKEERDFIFPEVKGYFTSFFSYWNACQKHKKGKENG